MKYEGSGVSSVHRTKKRGEIQIVIIQICVGSSCHLKGSQEIIEHFQSAIAKNKLDDKITLAGSFCTGQCNREGVTVLVDDAIHMGITKENFKTFFWDYVLKPFSVERS